MATYVQTYNNLYPEVGGVLWKQAVTAVTLAASAVMREPANTPNHQARVDWAKTAVRRPLIATVELWQLILTSISVSLGVDANGKPMAMEDAEVRRIVDETINAFIV